MVLTYNIFYKNRMPFLEFLCPAEKRDIPGFPTKSFGNDRD